MHSIEEKYYKFEVICKRCGNKYTTYSFYSFFQLNYFFGNVFHCDNCQRELRKNPKIEKKFNKIFLIYD